MGADIPSVVGSIRFAYDNPRILNTHKNMLHFKILLESKHLTFREKSNGRLFVGLFSTRYKLYLVVYLDKKKEKTQECEAFFYFIKKSYK